MTVIEAFYILFLHDEPHWLGREIIVLNGKQAQFFQLLEKFAVPKSKDSYKDVIKGEATLLVTQQGKP